MLGPHFFILLLAVGLGESFSPSNVKSPVSAVRVGNVASVQLHAIKHVDKRRSGSPSRHSSPRRVPPNKRTAIRWVIQGVERCLAEDDGKDGGGKTYKSVNDASLVDTLYAMVNAYNQKDILDAEKRLKVLMRNPNKYPSEVNERVIKATAMAGLASFSSALLKEAFLNDNGDMIPSSMAYTAVLNALRKVGEIDRMEETLTDLASASRRVSLKIGEKIGIDIVAFNTYVAAICDAVVKGLPFSPSATSISDDDNIDDGEISGFNFTTLENISSKTSGSEKYLYKAVNLLRGNTARTRFALGEDPDEYSYNQVLNAAAKCSRSDGDDYFTKSIILSCLRGMKDRGIKANMFTYNARLQATLASGNEDAAVQLIDQILSDPNVTPNQYTINFMLNPFINADRRDDIWSTINSFYEANIESNKELVSSAFEAFLVTIVQTGEIEFARDLFQHFFLKIPKYNKRVQMSKLVHVVNVGQRKVKSDDMSDESSASRGSILPNSRLPPKTKHFNILLGGYSKAFQSAVSKVGRTVNQVPRNDRAREHVSNAMPDVQEPLDLLGIMLDIGVPLDGFTVTSLMTLPYSTPENITSLLSRIEPEMMVKFNPAAYRSIISAYGKVSDPSSACWMFSEMTQAHRNQGRNVECWNAILGALVRGSDGAQTDKVLDILNSDAARSRRASDQTGNQQFISLVDGKKFSDASMALLDLMRNGTVLSEGYSAPKPNSQTYCLVASALTSGSDSSQHNSDIALSLFRNAMEEGVAADGRFLNAVLRCFGDDIETALEAWKSDIGPAAAAYERSSNKGGANVIAAYNGLMYVCGRAIRPDIATRIAYAMNKAGVEPTEVTLNSYLAGKRVALDGIEDGKSMSLMNQYETLLSVECTKYNTKDKRRVNDRKIRIILGG
ncbi:hypothetical protein ACHAWU_001833 [Discostella pseudostelligera]|uniref:Uncharacterized protein n=1 Tax=Discostella pseudostelligera TaxID=259834 RepID=A0ABD3M9Q7_9STRA